MSAPNSHTKSHLIQLLRKQSDVKAAKWFGPILLVQTNPCPKPVQWQTIVGQRFIQIASGCGDDECGCGLDSVWYADWRTKSECLIDWALGHRWGPKEFKL